MTHSILLNNLDHATRTQESVVIGGGMFGPKELAGAVDSIRALERKAVELETDRTLLRQGYERIDAEKRELMATLKETDKRALALAAEVEAGARVRNQLDRLMQELGGLTLAMLPHGGYGEALASLYCDIKAGR